MRIKQNVLIVHSLKSMESLGKHTIFRITNVQISQNVRIIQGSHYRGCTVMLNVYEIMHHVTKTISSLNLMDGIS